MTATATSTSTPRYISTRVNSRNAFSSEAAQPIESSVSTREGRERTGRHERRARRPLAAATTFSATPTASAHQAAIATAERSVSW